MRVTKIESLLVALPLRRSVRLSRQFFTRREFNIVRVDTDEGIVGIGYGRGGRVVQSAVDSEVAPSLIGTDPLAIEDAWQQGFERFGLMGGNRGGPLMRALSVVDIALWDVKAKAANLPLARLLGSGQSTVPAYVSAGYYRDGQTPDDLAMEMAGYVEQGWKSVKIRFGALALRDDLKRVRAVRRVIGDDIELAVDVNQGYRTSLDAIRAGRELEQLGVRWMEEPLPPEDIDGLVTMTAALDIPIATGETESTRWQFRQLAQRRAADILQPDVTVVGGISEWLKVAAVASAWSLPLAPHYFTEVHAHLVAATPGAITVEYFSPDADIISFDVFLEEPLRLRDGAVALPETPGVGLSLRADSVIRYRIA